MLTSTWLVAAIGSLGGMHPVLAQQAAAVELKLNASQWQNNKRGERSMKNRCACLLIVWLLPVLTLAADLPGAKDPPGMKRYDGSEIIGYREPKFGELLLPLGAPTQFVPPAYEKSLSVEGLLSRHTYMAPAGRTPA